MSVLLATVKGPHVDFAALSPILALAGGAMVVLLVGLARAPLARRTAVPALSALTLCAAIGLTIWQWHANHAIVSGALAVDDLALVFDLVFYVTGLAVVVLSLRDVAPRVAGEGEHHSMLLSSIAGMALLAGAQNLITLFIGFELLSIPLYVLCATELRRATSLESGLKYLVVGSVGSATLLYGLALVYGATGATDFTAIEQVVQGGLGTGLAGNAMLLTGVGMVVVGLAFKASVAPFHQWTPDVYEGAPTPMTAFMAIATKAAALAILVRIFDVALVDTQASWGPALAALATITIVVGNVGALGQSSLKRMLAYSGVAQAGYLIAGVVVSTQLGVRAIAFYLAAYLAMNLAAFAVVIARERETDRGDEIRALAGLGATRPLLAWPMTIAMLSLAGIPATAGFIGKFYLISATVNGGYAWLGVVIAVGSMISLGYYLRVVAVMWMREEGAPQPRAEAIERGGRAGERVGAHPLIAGGSPEADAELGGALAPSGAATSGALAGQWTRTPEVTAVAVLFAAASIFFGIVPSPLLDLARDAGHALVGLL